MMTLDETVRMMLSDDYKERFRAEYWQTKIRADKLSLMLNRWEDGSLDFEPTCPKRALYTQYTNMVNYLCSLRARADIENIEL